MGDLSTVMYKITTSKYSHKTLFKFVLRKMLSYFVWQAFGDLWQSPVILVSLAHILFSVMHVQVAGNTWPSLTSLHVRCERVQNVYVIWRISRFVSPELISQTSPMFESGAGWWKFHIYVGMENTYTISLYILLWRLICRIIIPTVIKCLQDPFPGRVLNVDISHNEHFL